MGVWRRWGDEAEGGRYGFIDRPSPSLPQLLFSVEQRFTHGRSLKHARLSFSGRVCVVGVRVCVVLAFPLDGAGVPPRLPPLSPPPYLRCCGRVGARARACAHSDSVHAHASVFLSLVFFPRACVLGRCIDVYPMRGADTAQVDPPPASLSLPPFPPSPFLRPRASA